MAKVGFYGKATNFGFVRDWLPGKELNIIKNATQKELGLRICHYYNIHMYLEILEMGDFLSQLTF